MGNTLRGFLVTIFSFALTFIVFVNFAGWSGFMINQTGVGNNDLWVNGYFGFSSLTFMVNSFKDKIDLLPLFTVSKFNEHVNYLISVLTFGLPNLINDFQTGNTDNILEILTFLRLILTQPIELAIALFLIIGHVIWYFVCMVQIVLQAITGYYNVEFTDTLNYQTIQQEYIDYYNTVRNFAYIC